MPVPIHPVSPTEARRFLDEKENRRRAALHGRYLDACRDFERIARHLAEAYRPLRIRQWGSLLDERKFSEISDIDIAVEGVDSVAVFFRMAGDAMEMTSFPVDIVEMERIDPLHAQSIRERGRVVYERQD